MHIIGSDEEESVGEMPQVRVGSTWEVVGPFPSGMREHPMMTSPLAAFPSDYTLDPDVDFATRPYKSEETFPSELGDGGRIEWKQLEPNEDGWVNVSYPDVRWGQLRMDHGWATLQYQTILRTIFSVVSSSDRPIPLLIDLIQGTEFALIPKDSPPSLPIIWYQGDVYDFANTPSGSSSSSKYGKRTSNFARSISVDPGEYVLLVRAMYEIRMFGDPGASGPVIRMKFVVEVDDFARRFIDHEDEDVEVEVVDGLAIVPDVIDGWLMGDWVSVGMRHVGEVETVSVAGVQANLEGGGVSFTVPSPLEIAAGQIRPVAVAFKQTKRLPVTLTHLVVAFRLSTARKQKTVVWKVPLRHHSLKDLGPFKITFSSPSEPSFGPPAMVSYAIVVPPQNPSIDEVPGSVEESHLPPVILALHGAGVDASSPFWSAAIPVRPGGWAVLPTGKNEWGEDYHGGSMADCWAARDVLGRIVDKLGITISEETLLIGHSNGGQGAWHLAARYPDRIVGLIVASGWLKIQDYVPYTSWVASHYADPSLMGILQSSLTPYNNDLYASNLAHLPILVIHGGDDSNVPPRHSRAHVNLISSWQGTQNPENVKLVEVPKQDHWWDDVFRLKEVEEFISNLGRRLSSDEVRKKGFTLTSANPVECGGKAGIRIVELDCPGKLARLDVNARQWREGRKGNDLDLHGMNVKRLEIVSKDAITSLMRKDGDWKESTVYSPRAYGPMIRLLATTAPLIFVIPAAKPEFRSLATRLAHDVYVYHRLDSEIVYDTEALVRAAKDTIGEGNVIVLGRPDENRFCAWLIAQEKIPLTFPTRGVMMVADKLIYEGGTGIITLHPHPSSTIGLAAIIAGNDRAGLELAARLVPLRTGVPVPDWAVVGLRSKWQSGNGWIGAGFWNGDWGWNEAMSWTDR